MQQWHYSCCSEIHFPFEATAKGLAPYLGTCHLGQVSAGIHLLGPILFYSKEADTYLATAWHILGAIVRIEPHHLHHFISYPPDRTPCIICFGLVKVLDKLIDFDKAVLPDQLQSDDDDLGCGAVFPLGWCHRGCAITFLRSISFMRVFKSRIIEAASGGASCYSSIGPMFCTWSAGRVIVEIKGIFRIFSHSSDFSHHVLMAAFQSGVRISPCFEDTARHDRVEGFRYRTSFHSTSKLICQWWLDDRTCTTTVAICHGQDDPRLLRVDC